MYTFMCVYVCMYAVCMVLLFLEQNENMNKHLFIPVTELITSQIRVPLNSKVVNNEFIRVT